MDTNKLEKDGFVPVTKSNPEKFCTKREALLWIAKYLISTVIGFFFGYAMDKIKSLRTQVDQAANDISKIHHA